jgi:hypothetical protein
MINDIKKNELNELEMENVAGGYYPDDNNPDNIIRSQEDLNLWMSFSWEERDEVIALPDANSRRAKMYEIGKRKANPNQTYVHGGGVSGGW